jgi:hypothetical protein
MAKAAVLARLVAKLVLLEKLAERAAGVAKVTSS